ncbi:molybdopterin-binding domain of aldehyde dehydrogenase domain-containing protein [Phthorimaea operculella]|nr:molybdopterin-binding domain of aldehyde dehydrogenase domain-containing protein [Phthorimaea operculella]
MDRIRFKINDIPHSVGSEISSDVSLLDYIRNYAELRGTKYMCREGGCGACIVTAVKSPGSLPVAVNSCLVSITSCHDWEITTVEKVGNRLKGYSVVQTTLAENNGTQCGYCTPGWVMAMHSLLQSKTKLTRLEIEQSFASNICRCTGYRPILEAFKKFAVDDPNSKNLLDIEELHLSKKCKEKCVPENCEDSEWCMISQEHVNIPHVIEIDLKDGRKWFKVYEVQDVFNIFKEQGDDSYMLVAGNTGKGAYPIEAYPRILIDVADVSALKGYTIDQNLVVGAGTTLSEAIEIFKQISKQEYFEYLNKFVNHLKLVAHIAVRNLGSIAGNLMLKHQHNGFASDIFLLLETVGAQLTIEFSNGKRLMVTMQQFLKTEMKCAVLLNVMLPPLSLEYNLVTYKIMPRAQNAHAIVNAGFLYKYNANGKVLQARIVYGGLSPTFTRAKNTEAYLVGKTLFTNQTLQSAIGVLKNELVVVEKPPEPSVKYRGQLAINLFYKGLLELCPKEVLYPRFQSGAVKVKETRSVSDARQIFDTDTSLWPLNKPIPKVEALIQCSGEAPYVDDMPTLPDEVFAAFVLTTVPSGNIVTINASKALAHPGVIAFYTSTDIPGKNSYIPGGIESFVLYPADEEILCSGQVKCFNQPLGIIVADTKSIAETAAKLVTVKYNNVKKPILDIKDASKIPDRNTLYFSADATAKGDSVSKVIKGGYAVYGQYHFSMETLVCVTKPTEDGMAIYSATQWIDFLHQMTSRALKIPQNKIDVKVVRLGGAYGIKVTRSAQVAIACSLVTHKLYRPCRFLMPLTTNMRAVGKRFPAHIEYEMGVNASGAIQYMNMTLHSDNGHIVDTLLNVLATDAYYNCYDKSRWNYKIFNTVTDTASNTWCRSPATIENTAAAETFMERISYELSLDPLQVRLANLNYEKYSDVKEMLTNLKVNAEYDARKLEVDKFNSQNRWKKRGLRASLLRWTLNQPTYYDINMSVFHGDGTVAITHAGIEMGQGINTKAVQIAAYFLKIPISKIIIKPNDTMISPNSNTTAGSFGSQYVCLGVQKCCEELNKKLEPIRQNNPNASWEEVIEAAFTAGVDLQTHAFVGPDDKAGYDIFGVACAEVELDVLTGEYEILRVDLLQDVGLSVSPEIDIGQVEGSFIMALGYWTMEKLVYDKGTGELLTDRTWNYHVPQARDIPQDFRVYFRKKSKGLPVFLGAKATGEPSMCLSVVVTFALREAFTSARLETGIPTTHWLTIDGPFTVENLCLACNNNPADYLFK